MRKLLATGVVVATALALLVPVLQAAPAQAAGTNTTVVLTFDDGVASQSIAASLLKARGMAATFYVNSNYISTDSGFLTWAQLVQMQADGNEIGGHTLDHPDLTTLPLDQVQTQVCQDRTNIMSHGLTVTDFAYPYGVGYGTDAVRQVVQNCGYNSARRAWGLYSAAPECAGTGCGYPYADTIPPGDALGVLAGDNPETTTTLAAIENEVTQATLTSFLDWLKLRAPGGTVVKTMRQVIGGPVNPADTIPPTTTIACNAAACGSNFYLPTTPVTLTSTDGTGSGVASIRYTLDGTDPTLTSTAYAAPFTLAATTTVKYRAYDNVGNAEAVKTQTIKIDSVAPTSTIKCNNAACSAAGYASTASVTLNAGDNAGGSGVSAIRYTLDGSDPTPASTAYSSPISVASTKTVKYRAYDAAGNAEAVNTQVVLIDSSAPSTAIACNSVACSGGWYSGSVQVSLTASDPGSGVAAIRYTTDGSDPTVSSTLYGGPFAVPATATVKFRAWDNTGNVEPTKSQLIQIDHVAPATAITCNGAACSSAWGHTSVKVSLTAADDGGSGLAAVRYTTDGSVPTAASPLYTAPFTVTATTTIRFRAFDNAGNEEAVRTQMVKIDKTRPTVALSSPKNHAAVTGKVRISVKVTDPQSGVAKVQFYVDGRMIATDTSPAFSFVWNTANWAKRGHTLTVKAYDRMGNMASQAYTLRVH